MRSDDNGIDGTAVFYQTELLAVALGAEPESIGMQLHMIKPDQNLLQEKKLSSAAAPLHEKA